VTGIVQVCQPGDARHASDPPPSLKAKSDPRCKLMRVSTLVFPWSVSFGLECRGKAYAKKCDFDEAISDSKDGLKLNHNLDLAHFKCGNGL